MSRVTWFEDCYIYIYIYLELKTIRDCLKMMKFKQQENDENSSSRHRESHFRLSSAAFLLCLVLFLCFLDAFSCSLAALSMLSLKRHCLRSRSGRAISDPKFGVYIVYIYCLFGLDE